MRNTGDLARRRVGALAAAVALATTGAVATGCAVGSDAQDPTSRAAGDNASVHGILLRNIFVLGPRPSESIPAGGTAQIYLTIVNSNADPDRLISVDAPAVARSVQLAGGPIRLSPDAVVEPGRRGSALILEDLTRQLRGGEYVRLTFRFAAAGTVTASVPVMPYAGFYTTYPPAATLAPAPAAAPATPIPSP